MKSDAALDRLMRLIRARSDQLIASGHSRQALRSVSGSSPMKARRSGRQAAESMSTTAPTASVEMAKEDDCAPAAWMSVPAA